MKTKNQAERLARVNLERQGFEVYLPMVVGKTCIRPLFPSYLFVRVGYDAQRWSPVLSTMGVRDVVWAGERPAPVAEHLIDVIRAQEIEGLVHLIPDAELPCRWEEGEKVELKDMPIEAVFIERVDVRRVAILFSCLGRDSRQEVHLTRLKPRQVR